MLFRVYTLAILMAIVAFSHVYADVDASRNLKKGKRDTKKEGKKSSKSKKKKAKKAEKQKKGKKGK